MPWLYCNTTQLLLLFTLVILELGLIMYQHNTIGNATREGARVGIIRTNNDTAIVAAVRALITTLDPADLDITIDCPQAGLIEVQILHPPVSKAR